MSFVSKRIASDVSQAIEKEKANKSFVRNLLVSSPSQIWKSKLSWRIALAVFMTILAVQAGILNFTLKQYESDRLNQVRKLGIAAVTPMVDPRAIDPLAPPFTDEQVNRLLSNGEVQGLAVYSGQLDLIKTYGEPMALTLFNKDANNLSKTYRTADGDSYEVVFRVDTMARSYIMVSRLNSSAVQGDVFNFVKQTILIMMLMSAFVTTVLMIALGRWLLEPILFMRNNLLAASKDPEDPKIQPSPFDATDEIGGAIDLAQRLILQNADNIKRIKSTAEDKIHKLAYYDTLTGLPNRTSFLQTLVESTRAASEDGNVRRLAIVTLDLDHFKDVNDSMGHNVGDAILRGVGKRLRAALPESAVVSRSGEDEFAVMMPLSTDINSARDVGERVQGVIRAEPFRVFNEQFQIRASIGVSTYPDDGLDPDQVLKNADIALNRAKEDGRDRIKEYSEDFDRAVQQRFQMLRDLRDAMERDQLALHYQPQLDLRTGKVIGAEALLRWWKPDASKQGGAFIPPNDFIPVAEQSGLIVPIGAWVLKTACARAKEWMDQGIDCRIAVNVSAAQFVQGDIVKFVEKVLQDSGLPPHKLELEVTESVFMADINHTIQTLQDLHALGVEIAIDDFGTGYSSLSYLRQFPIDRLKIDQSFIRNALNNQDDASIARTIVALGHSLNLKVIAEGVETKDHEKFLLEYGCDEVQGYRYSRPVPVEKFIEFAKAYNGDLSSFDKK